MNAKVIPDHVPNLVVLLIIHHYLPGFRTGGTIRATTNIVEWLGDQVNFRILTSDRDKGSDTPYSLTGAETWKNVGKAQVRYLTPSELSVFWMARRISQLSFDIFYLDSVLAKTTIQTLLLRKLRLIPQKTVIIAPRGHLDSGALSLKAWKKRIFLWIASLIGLYNGVIWHVSSEMERQDVISQFGEKCTPRLRVIPELTSPNLHAEISPLARKETGHLRLVYLSRISKKKNLMYLLEALKTLQGNITLDIYGYTEDEAYWEACQAIISSLPPNITVTYKGVVAFDEVMFMFAGYHLFALPTLGENFGHVILEALCAGCPVLISDRTPWHDVSLYGAGWALPLEEQREYVRVLQEMVNQDQDSHHQLSNRARKYGLTHTQTASNVSETLALFSGHH